MAKLSELEDGTYILGSTVVNPMKDGRRSKNDWKYREKVPKGRRLAVRVIRDSHLSLYGGLDLTDEQLNKLATDTVYFSDPERPYFTVHSVVHRNEQPDQTEMSPEMQLVYALIEAIDVEQQVTWSVEQREVNGRPMYCVVCNNRPDEPFFTHANEELVEAMAKTLSGENWVQDLCELAENWARSARSQE